MKNLILKTIQKIIYGFSEFTAPDVKYSERNFRVAKVILAIDELMSKTPIATNHDIKSEHPNYNEIIEGLKSMSNNYIVLNTNYVIPKSVLDVYIEYLDNHKSK